MCGRFTLTLDPGELQEQLDLGPFLQLYQPRYNIAPTQPIALVRDPQTRAIELFRWGLVPSWSKDLDIGSSLINARSETVHEKPSFHSAFKNRRCLILADGFFEWGEDPTQRTKQPYYYQLADAKPFTFAGLYEVWRSPEGDELPTCTIITCPANALVAQVHPRMPVILPPDLRWEWLSPAQSPIQLLGMLQSYPPDAMQVRPVSRLVNSPSNEGQQILE